MIPTFFIPIRRAVHGKNIIAQVPAKLLSNTAGTVKVKMYDLEKAITFTDAEFQSLFQPYDPTPEFVKDFEVCSITEGDLRSAGGRFGGDDEAVMWPMFSKCVMDAYMSCGNAKSCPITKYTALKAATAAATQTLESYKPQFNRRARNTFVIPADFDEAAFQKDPLPVGIDAHEFATKTEQNAILVTLVKQLYGFEGAPPMSDEMRALLGLAEKPVAGSHCCKYCCKPMELSKVAQEYKAKVHYLNLCHDDPKRGTRADNLYWGHTTCNREQGGCSTFERVKQGLQLGLRTRFTEEERAELGPLVVALQAALSV
jgi:hypothetical protein